MTKEIGTSLLLDVWAALGIIVQPSGAKIDNGWDLGEQPPHEYANWILNILGRKINHILQNGIPLWNAETIYKAGNFAAYEGVIYRAQQENSDSVPPNVNWQAVAPYPPRYSIELKDGFLQLQGDLANPGINKLYGTNGTGQRGWLDLPQQADGFKTGDLKLRYGSGALSGYVRCNGNSIGNVASAATERANDDVFDLYQYLYDADSNLDVSGGRGLNALADFNAGKRLTLPDAKNAALACLDGMGSANSDRLTDAVDGKTLGALGGSQNHALSPEQVPSLPVNFPNGSTFAQDGDNPTFNPNNMKLMIDGSGFVNNAFGNVYTGHTSGGGQAHNNTQPTFIFGTLYIKL